jgi:hypothetical protein
MRMMIWTELKVRQNRRDAALAYPCTSRYRRITRF